MVSSKTTPTQANPLGALFACHEDLGPTFADPRTAALLLSDQPLMRVVLFCEGGLMSASEAQPARRFFRNQGMTVVAAHYNRSWYPGVSEPTGGLATVLLAFESGASQSDLLLGGTSGLPLSAPELPILPGEAVPLRESLAAMAEGLGDCSALRFIDTSATSFDLGEACACDPPARLLGFLAQLLERRAVEEADGLISVVGSCAAVSDVSLVPHMSALLRFVGDRFDSPEAVLAANLCTTEMPASRKLAILDDIRSGLLAAPV